MFCVHSSANSKMLYIQHTCSTHIKMNPNSSPPPLRGYLGYFARLYQCVKTGGEEALWTRAAVRSVNSLSGCLLSAVKRDIYFVV